MEIPNEFIRIFTSKDGNTNTYIIPCRLLTCPIFKSWRLNRPPCMERVKEIRNYLLDNTPEKIDGEIMAARVEQEWNKGNYIYEIYDGNHRREAICSGYGRLYPNSKILLTIVSVKDDKELFEHFRRINKSIPLTEADLVGEPCIQDALYTIANEYCVKYSVLYSTSRNPRRPYFNREEFVDVLYRVYMECNLKNSKQLRELLDEMNDYFQNRFRCIEESDKKTKTIDGLTIAKPMYQLAKETGCYLFLSKDLSMNLTKLFQKKVELNLLNQTMELNK